MTKSELIEALALETNCSINTASNVISTIIDAMIDALVAGENVEIRGFGSFTVRHYDSYTGMNPKTKVKTLVKAKKLPHFTVGKELKEAVDSGVKDKP